MEEHERGRRTIEGKQCQVADLPDAHLVRTCMVRFGTMPMQHGTMACVYGAGVVVERMSAENAR